MSDTTSSITLTAAAEFDLEAREGERQTLPRFRMVAYTGGPMRLAGWRYPVVVDLAGLAIPSQHRPIRFGHDAAAGVGHTDSIAVQDGQLHAAGIISRATSHASDVVESARRGFPWQASIGAAVEEFEFVKEHQKAIVNGRTFDGPINIVRKATLGEISFVDLGADQNTSATVAASAAGEPTMPEATTPTPVQQAAAAVAMPDPAGVIAAAKAARDHARAVAALVEQYSSAPGADLDTIEQVQARAIDERMDLRDVELELLRLTRPRVSGVRGSTRAPDQKTLEATLLLACGISDERLAKDRDYGDAVVEAAWRHRQMGLCGVIAAALGTHGITAHSGRELYTALVAASQGGQIRAGFSSINLPGLLGNVANKLLLDAFVTVNATYEQVAQTAEFTNFYTHTMYRLDHTGEFAQVAPTGELKHGALTESSYSNKLETYGQMLTLPRQSVINDDLNAFIQLTAMLGRKARIAVEKALYSAVCEATDVFYTSQRGNLITSSGLAITTLGTAEAAMLGMVDAGGDPIYATPSILLVPPGLKALADQIYTSAQLSGGDTASGKQRPLDNPYRGRFTVVTSPYLASSTITGYSATTWYLLADPRILPAFQVAFLQGRRAPTIESSETEFNTLGVQMRCYWDFGVARVDYRGAVKATA